MTKQEIVQSIAAGSGLTKDMVSEVIEGFIAVVKHSVSHKEPVFIRGFGTFNPTIRKAKKGRNIGKGTSVDIPEHIQPTFKPAEDFKNICNSPNKIPSITNMLVDSDPY